MCVCVGGGVLSSPMDTLGAIFLKFKYGCIKFIILVQVKGFMH